LPETGGLPLGAAGAALSRSTTLSPRSPRPAEDAGAPGAAEAEIQRALLVGNYGAALDACLAVR